MLIFVFKNGSAPHINNVELGCFGRNRTNVWHYRGANSFGKDRESDLEMHPTVKPVAMVTDAGQQPPHYLPLRIDTERDRTASYEDSSAAPGLGAR
jgi:hypothetical protein